MSELPKSWALTTLPQVAEINPNIDKSTYANDLTVSFVPMPAVEAETGVIDVSQIRKFEEVKKGYTPFQKNDVLFAKITPCMENGKMALVPDLLNGIGFGSTEFHVLRAYEGIDPQFLYYYVSSKAYRYDAEHNMTGAVGQKRVPKPYMEKSLIPVPPYNEQKRIVAKIEELFSELDKGIESLKTAREQLKVYRQAVLKHAFEGKLTADWREKNKDKLETADELLERIKQEREAHYQQQLEKWKVSVKTWELNPKAGKKPTKPRKPTNAILSDENSWVDLPLLPEEWCWTTLSSISNEITDGDHQAPPQTSSGIPFIVISNIKNNKVDFAQTKFVPRNYYESISDNRKPQPGDILYTVTGSFGIPALIDFEKEFCFQRHVGLIKPLITVSNRFLYYALQSPLIYAQAQAVATGTAQKTVPLSGLRNFSIPLVSPREQKEIIEKLDTVFSEIDSLEHEVKNQLQKSEALRQSILKQAFCGKLVAQDPSDEPASVLLERIKAEKEGNKKKRNAA